MSSTKFLSLILSLWIFIMNKWLYFYALFLIPSQRMELYMLASIVGVTVIILHLKWSLCSNLVNAV